MKLKFKDYLSKLSTSFVHAAREATKMSLQAAEDAAEFSVDIPLGDRSIKLEGAANLPTSILMMDKAKLKTEVFLDIDDEGDPQVTLKSGLFKHGVPIAIEMDFDRATGHLESLEVVRDRANEINKSRVQLDREIFPFHMEADEIRAANKAASEEAEEPVEPEEPDNG